MQVIRRIIDKTEFSRFDIPENFAENAEIIILPYNDKQYKDVLTEDEEIYAINNNMIIDDNEEEDKIWEKYL